MLKCLYNVDNKKKKTVNRNLNQKNPHQLPLILFKVAVPKTKQIDEYRILLRIFVGKEKITYAYKSCNKANNNETDGHHCNKVLINSIFIHSILFSIQFVLLQTLDNKNNIRYTYVRLRAVVSLRSEVWF